MTLDYETLAACRDEAVQHLTTELLPFWLDRCRDDAGGGFLTHFDRDGNPTGEMEKSLIAQARTVYTMASAHRAGYGGGKCGEFARHGVDFLIDAMWDEAAGGFCWMTDCDGRVTMDGKIVYGQSFAIYALSEYTLATGDSRGVEYAERTFDLLQKHAADTFRGGYFEMFGPDWQLAGPGPAGGDRKTLDAHMHLMEAFTTLYECTGASLHRRKLIEDIGTVTERMLHPDHGTGIPQFAANWRVLPPIKFDVIWGWDRFPEGGERPKAADNTCYGHNVELAWLLAHAVEVLGEPMESQRDVLHKLYEHAVVNGIDREHGGVFVEGPHEGGVYDTEKEFWQQAEALIGLLDACLIFGPDEFWPAYENVHRFVFDKVIQHDVGEWWPLLTRTGEPIWTHMSHAWKVNYHTVRAMIQSITRLEKLMARQQPAEDAG
jgi:mannose 2-epimerase